MADLSLSWGADLSVGPTGDLAIVTESLLGQQRVIRRLLTSGGNYIWQPTYGAGLGGLVGLPVSVAQIRAVIRGQIFNEAVVAVTPEPVVSVAVEQAGLFNTCTATIKYTDSITNQAQAVNLTIGV
jgi:hypothetical protein